MNDGRPVGSLQSETLANPDVKITVPSLYKVIMWNDNHTPMDFVVTVLKKIFFKNHDEAHDIMLEIHNHDSGVCGIFTYEVAETKVTQVMDMARKHQYPLQCTLKKA